MSQTILINSYKLIVLSVISYILFIITNRIKLKQKINIKQEFIIILFIIYLLILFNIVTTQILNYNDNNMKLFKEITRYKIGSNLFFKNVIGNILLFIPFGLFLSYFYKAKCFFILIVTIIYSSLIETFQLLIGRVFDIDDIILNVIGSLVGYLLYKSR